MSHRKKKCEPFSLREVIGCARAGAVELQNRQRILQMDCEGKILVENCKGVSLYNEDEIRLDMGAMKLSIQGDGLMMDTYTRYAITIHGKIFAIRCFYGGEKTE